MLIMMMTMVTILDPTEDDEDCDTRTTSFSCPLFYLVYLPPMMTPNDDDDPDVCVCVCVCVCVLVYHQ
jgi:hypothetical protein